MKELQNQNNEFELKKHTKLVCSIGINDADYKVHHYTVLNGKQKLVWRCPFYSRWQSMLFRCYSKTFRLKKDTYIGCSTVPEWHLFSNFKAWMETQDWEGKELDKDILFKGNKIYGPNTCVFVDQRVNSFMIECEANRGEWPVGVSRMKNQKKFSAHCRDSFARINRFLGFFDTPEEAHKTWLAFKLEQAYILAAEQPDERVAKALIDRYENYL